MVMACILLINDERNECLYQADLVQRETGYKVVPCSSAAAAYDYVLWRQKPAPSVAVLKLSESENGSTQIIERLKKVAPELPVIVLASGGNTANIKRAIDAGAYDFISTPFSGAKLKLCIDNAVSHSSLKQYASQVKNDSTISLNADDYHEFSDSFVRLIVDARQASQLQNTLVIEGEMGTGKSCLARAIHAHSSRSDKPFIVTDTRYDIDQLEDVVERANGGTIMVNHAGRAPDGFFLGLEELYQRLFRKHIRLILCHETTGTPMASQILRRFLSKTQPQTLSIPPLRERRQDILPLAQQWLDYLCSNLALGKKHFSEPVKTALVRHDWPGNIYELKREIFTATSRSEKHLITEDDLSIDTQGYDMTSSLGDARRYVQIPIIDENGGLRSLRDVESDIIDYALTHYDGSRSDIARKLGIGRTTLYRKAQTLEGHH